MKLRGTKSVPIFGPLVNYTNWLLKPAMGLDLFVNLKCQVL